MLSRVARESRHRRCIAVDETKLSVEGVHVYVWSAVDVDSGEILAIYASWGQNMIIALECSRVDALTSHL